MNEKERKETALSESAQRLLGHVTQHAAANGTWSAKRKVVLKELAVSQATLGRALRELKEADLLQVVKAGGASVGIALLGGLLGGVIKGRQGAVVGTLLGSLGGGALGYLACPPSSKAEPKSATPVQEEEDIFEKIQKLVDGGPEAIQRFNTSESQSLSDWSPAGCV